MAYYSDAKKVSSTKQSNGTKLSIVRPKTAINTLTRSVAILKLDKKYVHTVGISISAHQQRAQRARNEEYLLSTKKTMDSASPTLKSGE
jgi:hypothetical protein